MAGLNKVMLIGNLGTDPEMRYTANGSAVTSFRLACSRSYTSPDGERKEETEWFTVVSWNKLAETVSQFLQKGRRASVECRLQTRAGEGCADPAVAKLPTRALGVPSDIAGAAVFLCSPYAEYVNGQTLVVDGGFLTTGVPD